MEMGQKVALTSDLSQKASSTLLPINFPDLVSCDLSEGSMIIIGQYLFSGVEATSANLTVEEVSAFSNWYCTLYAYNSKHCLCLKRDFVCSDAHPC